MTNLPFCNCGCGGHVTKEENKYILWHNLKERKFGSNNPFFGKNHTEESKRNMSLSRKGKESHRKGKQLSKETIEKIRKTHLNNGRKSWKKEYYLNDIPLYGSYFRKLTIEENPKRDKKDRNILTVVCTNCKVRFIPSLKSVISRVRSLKGSQLGECRLYCSEICKQSCTIYRKVSIQEGHPKSKNYTDEEYQTFRTFVLERDNYECQFCGEEATEVHHERPQKLEPFFALDPDFAWSCCKKCHYEKGHKDECSTGKLSSKIC